MGYVLNTEKQYDDSLTNSTNAANLSATAQKKPYEYNISQASSLYQPQSNAEYTRDMMERRALKERMANLGMSSSGGTSQVENAQLSNTLANNLTNVNLKKQDYINQQNNAMSQIDANTQAKIEEIKAQNQQDKSKALTAQKNADVAMYLQMLLSKQITPKYFTEKTGITL